MKKIGGMSATRYQEERMPEVFADFAKLEEWPGVGMAIPLRPIDKHPEIAQMEGQIVLLTDYISLQVQGRIVRYEGWWYGVPVSELQDIYPEAS